MAKKTKQRRSKFRPEEVEAYVTEKGWNFEIKGDNYAIEVCPYCGNDSHNFEIQKERGCFKCWACGAKGSFYELRKHQGDAAFTVARAVDEEEGDPKEREQALNHIDIAAKTFADRIWKRQPVLKYIKDRGFTDKTIRHFKIGAQKKDGKFWLTIPHLVDGKAVNLKYRSIPPEQKAWRQEKGSKKVLFNQDVIAKANEVILTEGELKSAALWQHGFTNTISLTGGIENFQPDWVDQLAGLKKIYLVMDADDAGQSGARKLAQRLGMDRCYNIVLPDAKDPDEWFFEVGHTADEFKELMRKAKQFDVENIITANAALADLQRAMEIGDVDGYQGLQTPWPSVNKRLGGMKGGDLILLGARPKIGKTSWALNIALHQAFLDNPVLFMCLEMSSRRIAEKIACYVTDTPDSKMLDAEEVAETRFKLRNKPLHMSYKIQRGIEPDDIFDSIRAAYHRYGLKLVVFDNIHFLVRSGDNLRERIGEVSQGFKFLAEELEIPIMLIVHPRKIQGRRQMTSDDFKETGSLHADADKVIILHREPAQGVHMMKDVDPLLTEDGDEEGGDLLDPMTWVIVEASRDVQGGRTRLWFEGGKSKFVEYDEQTHGDRGL